MEENTGVVSNFTKETILLFDKVCDVIISEKGYISEVEIQQLVSVLRKKVKKLQNIKSKDMLRVVSLEEFKSASNLSTLEGANKQETITALEVITDKMSNYLIHEKGTVIEKDIQDIANHLRIISSISNNNSKVLKNASDIIRSGNSNKLKNSLKSISITNISLIKNKQNIKRKQESCIFYSIKKNKEGLKKENFITQEVKFSSIPWSKSDSSTAISKNEIIRCLKLPQSAKNSSTSLHITVSRIETTGKQSKIPLLNPRKLVTLVSQSSVPSNISTKSNTFLCQSSINDTCKNTNSINRIEEGSDFVMKDEQSFSNSKNSLSIVKNGATNKVCFSQKTQQSAASKDRTNRSRSKWMLDKQRFINMKAGDVSNTFVYHRKIFHKQENKMDDDKAEKIFQFFNRIVKLILLQKPDIKESDIEDISRILRQYSGTKKEAQLKLFTVITPDMPNWALRGLMKNENSTNCTINIFLPLLYKMIDYIIYEEDRIIKSDIEKFCSILRKETKILLGDTKSKSRSKVTKSQKKEIHFKDEQLEAKINLKKINVINKKLKSVEEKSAPVKHENVKLSPRDSNCSCYINPNDDAKQKICVDFTIEEGIRSLEYIKRLSEKLLDDLDRSTVSKENSKRIPIMEVYKNNQLTRRVLKTAPKDVMDNSFKKEFYARRLQENENVKQKTQNIKNDSNNKSYFLLKQEQGSNGLKEKSEKMLASSSFTNKCETTNKTQNSNKEHARRKQSKDIEKKGNLQENVELSSARQKCFTSSSKYKNDFVKKTTERSHRSNWAPITSPNHSNLIQSTRTRLEAMKIKGQERPKIKVKKINSEQKENMPLDNTHEKIKTNTGTDDTKKNKIQCSNTVLKTCRTYSVFKPFQSKESNKCSVPDKPTLPKEDKVHPVQSKEFKLKHTNSKIPISTLYHTNSQFFSKK